MQGQLVGEKTEFNGTGEPSDKSLNQTAIVEMVDGDSEEKTKEKMRRGERYLIMNQNSRTSEKKE